MRIILFLLLLSNINLIAQNYSFKNLVKGTKPDTVYVNEPFNLDISVIGGIKNDYPILGGNISLNFDFQEIGVDTYLERSKIESSKCFLCPEKYVITLNTNSYAELGLPLLWKGKANQKYGTNKLIIAGRIDTSADISAVLKLKWKKLRFKLLVGQTSGIFAQVIFW